MKIRLFFSCLAASAIVGCYQVGLEPANDISEKIAYSYSINAALRTSADQALRAHAINKDDATKVLDVTDSAALMLKAAQEAVKLGDHAVATEKLEIATRLIKQVQNYINEKQVKK